MRAQRSDWVQYIRLVAMQCAEYAFAAPGAGPEETTKAFISKHPRGLERFCKQTYTMVRTLQDLLHALDKHL